MIQNPWDRLRILKAAERRKILTDSLPSGLPNNKNACFFNAALQVISSVVYQIEGFTSSPFVRLLYGINETCQSSASKNSTCEESVDLESGEELHLVSPYDRLTQNYSAISKDLDTMGLGLKYENDSHEALMILLDKYCYRSKETDPPFVGRSCTLRRCLECRRNPQPVKQPFSILSVPCTGNTVEECLSKIGTLSLVTGVECLSCSIKATISKIERLRVTITQPSLHNNIIRSLAIQHLIRAWSMEDSDQAVEYLRQSQPIIEAAMCPTGSIIQTKTNQFIRESVSEWPDVLFLHLQRASPNGKLSHGVQFSSVLSVDQDEYHLQSIIVHFGQSVESGHFAAYRRWDHSSLPQTGQKLNNTLVKSVDSPMMSGACLGESSAGSATWVLVDDESVVKLEDPLKELFMNPIVQKNLYMLVYTKQRGTVKRRE